MRTSESAGVNRDSDSDYGHAAVVDPAGLRLAAKADVHAGGVCGRQHARTRARTDRTRRGTRTRTRVRAPLRAQPRRREPCLTGRLLKTLKLFCVCPPLRMRACVLERGRS